MKVKTLVFIFYFFPFLLLANTYSDSLLYQLKILPFDTNRVNTNYKLAEFYSDFNGDSAMFYTNSGDSLARKLNYALGIADGYFYKALSFQNLSQTDSAIVYYEKDIDAFKKLGMLRGVAFGYSNIGSIYSFKGDYLNAYKYFLNYHRLSVQLNDSFEIAQSYCALAKILRLTGDLDKSLIYLSTCLNINHKLNIPDSEEVLSLLGTIYLEQHELEIALKYFQQGLNLASTNSKSNKQWIALFKYDIGRVYAIMKDFNKAIIYYKYADSLYVEANLIQNHALISRQIAEVLFKKNQFSEAFRLNGISLQVCKSIVDKNGMAEALTLEGKMNSKLKRYAKAVINFKEAYSYTLETGDLPLQKTISGNLSEAYLVLGDYKNAYASQYLFNQLSDKILNKENIAKLARLDLQYQFDKTQKEEELKQKQKELLYLSEVKRQKTTRNAILVSSIFLVLFLISIFAVYRLKQNERMQKLERELKVSVQQALSQQMNPHFIFNCLNSIYSLMQENRNDEASGYFTMFASLMRKNLEYSQQSAIFISHEIEALEMYVKLEQLRFPNLFSFSIHIDDEIDQYTFKIPSLLLQPFV